MMQYFVKTKGRIFFAGVFLLLTGIAWAETAYVTDELQFMVRTGKDLSNKIVAIARSGDQVEVVERDGDWAYVRFEDKEGWMLGRFLVPEPPGKVRMVAFERDHERLKERFSKQEAENRELKAENGELKNRLSEKEAALETLNRVHETLKEEAGEFLALKEDAARIRQSLEAQKALVEDLDAKLLQRNIKMFALGAGVLLLGMILGISMRKKQKSSYY